MGRKKHGKRQRNKWSSGKILKAWILLKYDVYREKEVNDSRER